jgi:beta-phosphoglucomutase
VKAVIFDLDGVITDTAKYHFLAWRNLARSIGIQIDASFNEQLRGIGRMASLERILQYGNQADRFSADEKRRLAEKKNKDYRHLIAAMNRDDMLPGIAEFLSELKQAGIRLGLASASKNGSYILERLNITPLFDTIVDPAQLKRGKPDPEIFATAVNQLGLMPDECVGIEDAAAGIQSIHAAGLFAVGVGVPGSAHADWRVETTDELTLAALKQHVKANKQS